MTLCILLSVNACQISTDDNGDTNIKISEDAFKNIAKTLEDGLKAEGEKQQARREKGDTVALHYKDLEAFLPSISGYRTDGEAKGNAAKVTGFGYSQIEQKYSNGSDKVTVKIADYNGAAGLFGVATAAIKSGIHIESDNQIIKGLDLGMQDVAGIETWKKQQKNANITMAVGTRFVVTIKATNQDDTDFVKGVAKNLPLNKMVNL
jgi:hypothetical protein